MFMVTLEAYYSCPLVSWVGYHRYHCPALTVSGMCLRDIRNRKQYYAGRGQDRIYINVAEASLALQLIGSMPRVAPCGLLAEVFYPLVDHDIIAIPRPLLRRLCFCQESCSCCQAGFKFSSQGEHPIL
jgi:hypothetical protein